MNDSTPTEPDAVTLEVTVYDGKYTVRLHKNGRLEALRYGEPWRELSGDGLVLQLACEIEEKQKSEAKLRELLWLRHGCSIPALYGDDGEMQCSNCVIDFKRDPVEVIEERWRSRAEKAVRAAVDGDVAKEQGVICGYVSPQEPGDTAAEVRAFAVWLDGLRKNVRCHADFVRLSYLTTQGGFATLVNEWLTSRDIPSEAPET